MAWPIVGKSFSPKEFAEYVKGLRWDGPFRPKFTTVHNTAVPSLAQRPAGLTRQHLANLESYYKKKGWSGGPHLFIDDRQIWVFNDLTKRGTHSPSWNGTAIGIEMLGDFECEPFNEGRGAKVRANTVAAMAVLNRALGFPADGFKFHIEDKASDHACPGKLARGEREELVAEIEAAMAGALNGVAGGVVAAPASAGWSWFSEASFAKVNGLADEGSRLAAHIKGFKTWFWRVVTTMLTGGTVVTVAADTSKGTAQVVASDPKLLWIVLGAAGGALFALLLAYLYVKFGIEKWFVSAVKDNRYKPKGA